MLPFIQGDRLRSEREALVARTPPAKARSRAQARLWRAEGLSAEEVAELLRVTRQAVSNGVGRFQGREGLDLRARLLDAPRSGRPPTAQGGIDPRIAAVIGQDPRQLGARATTWTAALLMEPLERAHGLAVARQGVGLAVARLRIRGKRPRHPWSRRPAAWRPSQGG